MLRLLPKIPGSEPGAAIPAAGTSMQAAGVLWRYTNIMSTRKLRDSDGFCFSQGAFLLDPPAIGALSHPFFGWEGSPTKIGVLNKVGTLTLTSPLEDLGLVTGSYLVDSCG